MPQDAQPTTEPQGSIGEERSPLEDGDPPVPSVEPEPSAGPEAASGSEAGVPEPALELEVAETVQVDADVAPSAFPVGETVGAGVVALVLILMTGRYILSRAHPPGVPRPSLAPFGPPATQPAEVDDSGEESPPDVAEESGVGTDPPGGLGARLVSALSRTSALLRDRVQGLFGRPVDEALLEELEEILLIADVGVSTSQRILDHVREHASDPDLDLSVVLREEMRRMLDSVHRPLGPAPEGLWVILVVGVNGSGKTTTIGKLASRLQSEGRSVLLAAGDTYRAAAAEQLGIWAERSGADFVRHQDGADPAAVAYDALEAAKSRGRDVVIIDTAGRLQTRKPLMEQLSKMRRVIAKQVPDAPHETLLVVDGTMGQNALSQARLFHDATPLTGVAVTKLDGTAKGGMVLAIASEMGLPVQLIGVGEQVGDLQDFDPAPFVDAIL